ncbi:hypothetical protein ABH892_004425 [Paenibacillus sp. RC254]
MVIVASEEAATWISITLGMWALYLIIATVKAYRDFR